MIDMKKKYRTEKGYKVRLYATDRWGVYPVHGAVLIEDVWRFRTWTKVGRNNRDHNSLFDLVEVVETKAVGINLNEVNKENGMKFTNTDPDGCTNTIEFDATDMHIHEVLQHFTCFLRGCGYIIDSDQYISVEQND